jgi:hypothetical protein
MRKNFSKISDHKYGLEISVTYFRGTGIVRA